MTPLRSEIEARISAIEKRLDAATPGPWTLSASKQFVSKKGKLIAETYPGEAELIANSPSDLRYLLSIVKAAMGLYDVVDDNKKASEQGFQVYPLEKDILKALTAFEKAVRGK